MNHESITNQNLMQLDFARTERIAFLNNIADRAPEEITCPARNLPFHSLWIKKVFVINRRPIKTQLIGQSNHRAHWWRVRYILPSLFKPCVTLEQQTLAFRWHPHHRRTIARLILLRNLRYLHTTLEQQKNAPTCVRLLQRCQLTIKPIQFNSLFLHKEFS